MFCYIFRGELQGPAWAVGSYSVSQSAGGIYHYIIFKTLRQTRRIALYIHTLRGGQYLAVPSPTYNVVEFVISLSIVQSNANFISVVIHLFQVFLVKKNVGKDAGTLYAMKVLKKATLKGQREKSLIPGQQQHCSTVVIHS